MSKKLSHRVPLPKFGEGVYLFFSMQGISELEDIYGEGGYFEVIEQNLNNASAKTTINCLRASLMKDNVKFDINFNLELPYQIDELALPLLDAMCLAIGGMTHTELREAAEKRLAEQQARIKRLTDAELAREAAEKREDPFENSEDLSDSKPTASSPGSRRKKSGA